jgi:hypothetical protein
MVVVEVMVNLAVMLVAELRTTSETVIPLIAAMVAPVAKLAPVIVTVTASPGDPASGLMELTTGTGFSIAVVVKVTVDPYAVP